MQRNDDLPEAIDVRLQTYDRETRPLIDFYENAGLLLTIDANGTPKQIAQRSFDLLSRHVT